MEQKALVLCDAEADYAQQMAGFLEREHDFPWKVIVCTGVEELEQMLQGNSVDVVVIAESMIGDTLPQYPAKQFVLLNESGRVRFSEVKNIDKYQEADNVRKALLSLCVEQKRVVYPALDHPSPAVCVAFYSPVRRCLQTSTAITYGQLLAERHRVLYLNFECFYGGSMEDESPDLISLLYYVDAAQEEFSLHMRSIRRSIGNWDYVMPMRNGENLPETESGDWLKLMEKCRMLDEYDYVVLDLNDSMQGVIDILRQSDRIYTLIKGDSMAQTKLDRYEYLLKKKQQSDILQKSVRLQMPGVSRLPVSLEDYSRGELADYVRKKIILEEDKDGVYGMEAATAG